MDIDKKLVQNTELTFLKENLTKTLLLNDDGIVELYEEGKLIDSKPFSKINVERDYKKIIQEGYTLVEDKRPLTDEEKVNYYYGTVRSSIPYEVYKIDDKFYDGNGFEIDKEEIDTLTFFKESKEQVIDRVDELEAENGCGAYYKKEWSQYELL